NLLCLTGDGVQAGDHPQALPVFDLDALTLLETARTLRDEHHFLSGRKITHAPRVLLGAAENPFADPIEWRAQRPAKKVAAGALEGRRLCIDLIQEIRTLKGVHGVHVMAYRQEETVAEIIQRSGVLGGRVPWNPGRDPPANTNRIASEPTPSAALEPARS